MAECPRCGARFDCNPGPDCWCVKVPFRPWLEKAKSCLCPACLESDQEASRQHGRQDSSDANVRNKRPIREPID